MCDEIRCANKGCFEGEICPGSDSEEEMHHCVLCFWLTWDAKSLSCDACGRVHCPNCWQNTFVNMGDCENEETHCFDSEVVSLYNPDREWVCALCFLSTKEWWCADKKCLCPQKELCVASRWEKHRAYLKTENV